MPFIVLAPPAEEAQFAELGKEILAIGRKLGLNLHTEGFLLSWVGGTRVLVERTEEGLVSLALLTVGQRWTDSANTATLIANLGEKQEAMLDFAKQIATALGATKLYHEEPIMHQVTGRITHTVYEDALL